MAKKNKKHSAPASAAPASPRKLRKFRLMLLDPKGANGTRRHSFRCEGVKYELEQANVYRREFDPERQTAIEVEAGSAVAAHCDQCPMIEELA